MSVITDMTKEELASSLNEHVNEIDQLVLELEERYDLLWESYEELDEDHRSLGYKNLELKEENDVLKQEESEFPKAYDLGFEEGFAKGEQSMQEKAKKIVEFWDEADDEEIEDAFSDMEYGSAFENINKSYDKIIEYENEKEEIHVGDEVVDEDGDKYVVRCLLYGRVCVMSSSGWSTTFEYNDLSKTGKHYPLEEILKELE